MPDLKHKLKRRPWFVWAALLVVVAGAVLVFYENAPIGGKSALAGALKSPSLANPLAVPGDLLIAWGEDMERGLPGDVDLASRIRDLGSRYRSRQKGGLSKDAEVQQYLYAFIGGRITQDYERWAKFGDRAQAVTALQRAWADYCNSIESMDFPGGGVPRWMLDEGRELIYRLRP